MLSFISSAMENPTVVMILKGLLGLVGTAFGYLFGWLVAGWRWRKWLRKMWSGDALDVITIEQVLITDHSPQKQRRRSPAMRIRTCGAKTLCEAFPNVAARDKFIKRVSCTSMKDPLVDMSGRDGSYVLNELHKLVCAFVANRPFNHDRWVMAVVQEPKEVCDHQSITLVLVRECDLETVFLDWETARNLQVEHRADGARIITLHLLARRYVAEKAAMRVSREKGEETRFGTTMFLLDLTLDTRFSRLDTRAVPWNERFKEQLMQLGLHC